MSADRGSRGVVRVRARRAAVALLAVLAVSGCGHLVFLHDPLSANEHNDLGAAYESRGELKLAAREYRAALRLDSHHHQARYNLGNVAAAEGRWPAAEKCYRRALRDSSSDADVMNNLAIALLRQGRSLAEARALAERAVAIGGQRESTYRATLSEVKAGADAPARKPRRS